MKRKWLRIDEQKPEYCQKVFFWFGFFDQVYAGEFEVCEDGYNCFFNKGGFLCDDITYWMPREDGDEMPEHPSDEEKATCLYHPKEKGWKVS